MNQTYTSEASSVGVGLFSSFFPPQNIRKFFWPNPTHSNPREKETIFLGIRSANSCASSKRIPSLLVSPLVYRRVDIPPLFLTTVSRGFISPSNPPADNYTNDYLAWGGNKKNAKIPSVDNYLNDFYNYKKILIKKNHKLFSSVNIYLNYFYNYKKNYKLFVTLCMGA